MARRAHCIVLGVCLFLMIPAKCDDSNASVNDQFNTEARRIEKKMVRKINRLRNTIRAEMKKTIDESIKRKCSDTSTGENEGDTITSRMISEVRHLERANHQMKREMLHMKQSMDHLRDNRMWYTVAIGEGKGGSKLTRLKCLECQTIDVGLVNDEQGMTEGKHMLNFTCLCRLLEEAPSTPTSNTPPLNRSSSSKTKSLSTAKSSTTTTSSTVTASTYTASRSETTRSAPTTTKSPLPSTIPINLRNKTAFKASSLTRSASFAKSRIFVAPVYRRKPHPFFQVDTESRSTVVYPNLPITGVMSMVYVASLDSLLLGVNWPRRIVSYRFGTSRTQTLKSDISVAGMAADEGRGILFITTYSELCDICRMTFNGRHFTKVFKFNGLHSPRAIALNPETEMIYSCIFDKVFSLRYDGSWEGILDTGSFIDALTLDASSGLLFYSKDQKLMKMTLSTNTSSEVADLGVHMLNLVYARDTVYYTGRREVPEKQAVLGAVNVGHKAGSNRTQIVSVSKSYQFAICLIQ